MPACHVKQIHAVPEPDHEPGHCFGFNSDLHVGHGVIITHNLSKKCDFHELRSTRTDKCSFEVTVNTFGYC